MQRILLPLALTLALFALVACGGDDGGGEPVGGTAIEEGADVDTVLENTFSEDADAQIDSGRFALDVGLDAAEGAGSLSVSAAFETRGDGELPLLDIDAEVELSDRVLAGGLTLTGDAGFVALRLPGEDAVTQYELSPEAFDQLDQIQAQTQDQAGESCLSDLGTLGVDPRNWLTDAQIADESADVEGTETVRIAGGVDVAAFLDDLNPLLECAGSLSVLGTEQVPSRLTGEQQAQLAAAIGQAQVVLEAGKEDSVLRRLQLQLSGEDDGQPVDAALEYTASALNEDQSIEAPEDPQPFAALVPKLGGLGTLGGLGG